MYDLQRQEREVARIMEQERRRTKPAALPSDGHVGLEKLERGGPVMIAEVHRNGQPVKEWKAVPGSSGGNFYQIYEILDKTGQHPTGQRGTADELSIRRATRIVTDRIVID